jgi:hypothetical protein
MFLAGFLFPLKLLTPSGLAGQSVRFMARQAAPEEPARGKCVSAKEESLIPGRLD